MAEGGPLGRQLKLEGWIEKAMRAGDLWIGAQIAVLLLFVSAGEEGGGDGGWGLECERVSCMDRFPGGLF